jgi:hypothetical protein
MDLHAKIIIFGKTREQDMFFIHLGYQPRGNCTLHYGNRGCEVFKGGIQN